MTRIFADLLAAASLFAAVPAATHVLAVAELGSVAPAACTKATIGGQATCIARGQFCASRYERDSRRYRF